MLSPIDHRAFLKTSGAALTAATVAAPALAANDAPRSPWKKAFKLVGKTKGSILPTFELLKEAGFEGVEPIAPNQLDLDEVLRARYKTGIVIHGVSGAKHWGFPLSSPNPRVMEEGLAAVRQSMIDCKAYGGTTTLLVPTLVTQDRLHIETPTSAPTPASASSSPMLKSTASRSPSKKSGTSSCSALPNSSGLLTRLRALRSAIISTPATISTSTTISTSATSSSTTILRSGFASRASGFSRSTSRNTPRPSASATRSARERLIGPPSARSSSTSTTTVGSPPKSGGTRTTWPP